MRTHDIPRGRRTLIATAVAIALTGVAASAFADPLLTVKLFRDADIMFRDGDMSRYAENYVELGAGYNSNDSYRFGQFSGLYDQGVFAIANLHWQQRDPSNDARYWRVFGANLGLESKRMTLETGEQGRWNGYVGADRLTRSETDSARFVHSGLGTNTLVQNCADAASAAAVSAGCLTGFGIQQQRDIYRFGVSARAWGDWDFKVDYREDRRDGTRLSGFYFTSSTIVPYHTNDRTQQVETLLAYTGKNAQWQMGYQYSKFSNNDLFFQIENPFNTSAGNALGRMSLNPDNDFHQIHTTAAYNLSRSTRITGQLSYGVARQNEKYLDYSTAGVPPVVPPSLDGKVVHTNADLALITRPLDKLTLKVAYQFVDRDNQSPVNTYTYYSRDTYTTPGTANVRTNAPLSSSEHKVLVDTDYEIAARTFLRAVLEHRKTTYALADRTDTATDRASIELRRPVSDEFLGALGYTYTQRTGSDYYKNRFFEASYPSMQGSGFTNHPSMRQFLWNDFRENRVRASGNWTATETTSLQATLDGYHQRSSSNQNCSAISVTQDNNAAALAQTSLPDTCLGRDLAAGGSVNLDVQWQPEENITTFAFVNYAVTETDIHGRHWSGTGSFGPFPATQIWNDWFANMTMYDRAAGVGFKWQPQEAWDFGGTYVYSNSHGAVYEARYNGANMATIPDTNSRLHTVQLFAKWDATKSLTWRLNYVYEMLRSQDYSLDNAVAAPGLGNTNVLYTGRTSPNYINHVVGVSVAVKSW